MTSMRALACGLEGLCAVICAILLLQQRTVKIKRGSDRWFKQALAGNIGASAGSLALCGFSGTQYAFSHLLTAAGAVLYCLCAGVCLFSFFAYIYSCRDSVRPGEKMPLVLSAILAAAAVGLALVQDVYYGAAALPLMITLALFLTSTFVRTAMDEQLDLAGRQMEEARIQALQELQQKRAELTGEIIFAISNTVEAKDRYTNGHSQRVAIYAREIVRRMGWSEEEQEKVYYTGMLHDVGKIRMPDTIINKKDRLNNDEFAQIKLHTMAGYYILKEVSSVGEFAIGARWHHERYDGTGYPNGLSGDSIPIIARIIAVADAYDAMTSNRSYREVMPQAEVRKQIARGAGTQFDPKIVAIMLQIIDEDTSYRLRQPDLAVTRVILAIDDDRMVHKTLEAFFRAQPMYKLRSAFDGASGLEILKNEAVDLVLLDVEMPGMNGFEVLSHIREDRRAMPVIFMTGDKDIDMIRRAEQLGVSDYLSKPLVAHMLMESIQNVLLNSRTMQWSERLYDRRRGRNGGAEAENEK